MNFLGFILTHRVDFTTHDFSSWIQEEQPLGPTFTALDLYKHTAVLAARKSLTALKHSRLYFYLSGWTSMKITSSIEIRRSHHWTKLHCTASLAAVIRSCHQKLSSEAVWMSVSPGLPSQYPRKLSVFLAVWKLVSWELRPWPPPSLEAARPLKEAGRGRTGTALLTCTNYTTFISE